MIPNVDVFGLPFLDRVRSNEDRSHVVTTNGDSPEGETQLLKEGFHPHDLSTCV